MTNRPDHTPRERPSFRRHQMCWTGSRRHVPSGPSHRGSTRQASTSTRSPNLAISFGWLLQPETAAAVTERLRYDSVPNSASGGVPSVGLRHGAKDLRDQPHATLAVGHDHDPLARAA